MFQDDYKAASNGALGKWNLLKKNPLGYLMSSVMAGLFIGLGCVMMGIVNASLVGSPAQKLTSGIVFSVGLCLVTLAGAELFTGNNFVMTVGAIKKTVSWAQVAKVWIVCYIGNLIGSIITAVLFVGTGLGNGAAGEFFVNAAAAKAVGTPVNLFAKGILCNILVCLAVWCATRLKSEGAKIAMNFCCVGTFVTCGFEHSVANMTFFSAAMMLSPTVTLGGFMYNLLIVTLGNMVGGIVFVALPYYLISKEKGNA